MVGGILKSFILASACLAGVSSAADSVRCKPVSIDLKSMGPLRNQGVSGLCFAYGAADLASWALGRRVSAMDLALYEFRNSKAKKMGQVYNNGGDTADVFNSAAKDGFCSEMESPSDEPHIDFSANPRAPLFDAFKVLDKNNWDNKDTFTAARKIFPNLSCEAYLAASAKRTVRARILALQKQNCRTRFTASHLSLSSEYPENSAASFALIDRELNSKKPVGIAFHSNDLYTDQDEYDGHSVALVGRRWNSESRSCEYLIRDTFGKQCDIYKSHLDCQDGYIWVSEKFLKKNIFEVMRLGEK